MISLCLRQPKLIITWTQHNLYNNEEFFERRLELMEPQNQVRVETILPDLCFQGFLHFSYVDGVGDKLPYTQARVYFI